jgi:hypothetical protein
VEPPVHHLERQLQRHGGEVNVSRGKSEGIKDPAFAIAAGKCWLARWRGGAAASAMNLDASSFHPSECTFCGYSPEELIDMLEAFLKWAGLNPPSWRDPLEVETTPLRAEVEGFLTLPPEEQERTVQFAQGYRD